MSLVWNNVSGGTPSVAMALLHPKNPCLVMNTGANLPEAWQQIYELQKRGHKIIVLSSFQGGYPTYYEYIKNKDLLPFYSSCSYRAKIWHWEKFFNTIAPNTVNIGLIKGEEKRLEEFNSTWKIRYLFPMITYTRKMCEKILRKYDMIPLETRSGCWFCGRQPKTSWKWLKRTHPDKYQEAEERGWLPKFMIVDGEQS